MIENKLLLADFIKTASSENPNFYSSTLLSLMRFPKSLRMMLDNQPYSVSDIEVSKLLYDYFSYTHLIEKEDLPYYDRYSKCYTATQKSFIKMHNINNEEAKSLLDKSFETSSEMWTEVLNLIDKGLALKNNIPLCVKRLYSILSANEDYISKAIEKKTIKYNKVIEGLICNTYISGNDCVGLLKLLNYDRAKLEKELDVEHSFFYSIYRHKITQTMFDYNGLDVFDYFNSIGYFDHHKTKMNILELGNMIHHSCLKNIMEKPYDGFGLTVQQLKKVMSNANKKLLIDLGKLGFSKECIHSDLPSLEKNEIFFQSLREGVNRQKFNNIGVANNIEDVLLLNFIRKSQVSNVFQNNEMFEKAIKGYNNYVEMVMLKDTAKCVDNNVLSKKIKV